MDTLQDYGVETYALDKCHYDFQYAKLFALIVTFPVTRRFFYPPSSFDHNADAIRKKILCVRRFIDMALAVIN